MLFLHPMWDNESQRIGMQRCWKTAYLVHGYGELVGFLGLLALLGTIVYLAYQGIFGSFNSSMWWLFCVPFGMGVISETMVQASWVMVARRGFEYDYDDRVASWLEEGQRVTYKYAQEGDAMDDASRRH
jgi:hypothetical protein